MSEHCEVFISYAQADGEIAASLATALDDLGMRPFLAQRHVNASENWEATIRAALKRSKLVLCVLTPRSKGSTWVHAEAGAAWALEKPILPALMFVEPHELIEILRLHQGRKIESPDQVRALIDEVKSIIPNPIRGDSKRLERHSRRATPSHERFNDALTWQDLLHIGPWQRDANTGLISGSGMHNYLLSQSSYSGRYSVIAALKFLDLHAVNRLDAVNAGILVGWSTPRGVRRYFNLLMNEERMLLELVGGRGGDSYSDYEHIDRGIPFILQKNKTYLVRLEIQEAALHVYVHAGRDSWVYETIFPEIPAGRVGVRPWRSRIEIAKFEVST